MIEKYYEPKYLYGLLKELSPINAFFRKNYFAEKITFPTETVTFERMNAYRKAASFFNDDMPAPVDKREGYSVRSYKPQLIGKSRVIDIPAIKNKLAGEAPYNSGVSPEERAAEIAANDLEQLQGAIQRKEEILCSKLKQDGKIIIDGDAINGVVEYGFTNIEETASADKWASGYDILGKLEATSDKLLQDGINPDMLILGKKAADALLANTKIAKLLDNRRINFGEIVPGGLANGVQYLGKLIAAGVYLDLYLYRDFYKDDDGQVKPYIDDGTVIMQNSQEKNYMLYGAVNYIGDDDEFVTSMNDYVPYTITSKDPPVKKLIVASRPLPMPAQINSWYVLKNVV